MRMLARFGGKPVREAFLSYAQQWLDEDDCNQVIHTLQTPLITQGPVIEQFEKEVSAFTGAKFAVAFSSGTAALHAACYAAGLGEGDEVLTTPNTFVASANCALYVGASPRFVDIDPLTYNINPSLLTKHLTDRTKAIIPVDFSGQPSDLEPILQLAKKHNLIVIEDAAHALGATYKNQKIGSLCDMTMFSFHPVKLVTTGEGGVITTNNSDYYKKLLSFRTHGITKDFTAMGKNEGPWYYEMQDLGYNYRLTDLQAALGVSQLKKIEHFLSTRRKWANLYNQAFSEVDGIITPYQLKNASSSWHLYVILLELEKFRADRREIFEALRAENIGVHVHYIPVYWQPYYERLGFQKGICPQAEAYYQSAITLPLFARMSEYDVETVIEGVKKVVNYYKK